MAYFGCASLSVQFCMSFCSATGHCMCICKGGLIAFHPHSFAGTARLYGSGRGDCLTCHPSCDHCSVGRTACMLSVWLLSHAYWLWWPGTPHPPPCMFVQGGGCGCMWSCAGALVTSQAWWVGWCPHPPLASIGVCCSVSTPPRGLYLAEFGHLGLVPVGHLA